jgi:hypothetical protein
MSMRTLVLNLLLQRFSMNGSTESMPRKTQDVITTSNVLITEISQDFISGYLYATRACSTIARNCDGFVSVNQSAVISL